MLNAKQNSAMPERKSKAYIECVISAISCLIRAISSVFSAISRVFRACIISAMGDGNCSLRWSATVSVVQESM